METKDYLNYLVKEIHTCIVATVDEEGLPVTAAIDMMDSNERGLVFLTARGKSFYERLKARSFLALTALKGEDTLSSKAISLRGKVRELGYAPIPELLEKNPYMYEIYPTEASRQALTAFQIYEGEGEWFDLSVRPIERASFTFGKASGKAEGYFIRETCSGCGKCLSVCPQDCIREGAPFRIEQEHCLHCGNCLAVCPCAAVEKR